jgi:hypothetical protein
MPVRDLDGRGRHSAGPLAFEERDSMPKTAAATDRGYHVYIIELDSAAHNEKVMKEANPGARRGQTALYVGQTWRTPKVRFEQHKSGHKASRMVRRFGVRLRHDLMVVYGKGPLRTRANAEAEESRVSAALRDAGFVVWSN